MAPTAIVWRRARRSASSVSRRARWRPSRSRPRSAANGARNNTATATTATARTAADEAATDRPAAAAYVGRFAPSPTGELHLGSLYTAAASYLDARAHDGEWRVRIEDIDLPRVLPGAADRILRTLERFGLEWTGEPIRQSERTARYQSALETLRAAGLTFDCSCSRSQLMDEERYPGHCRAGAMQPDQPRAVRVRVDPRVITFNDRIQGTFRQDVAAAVGDVVIRRRDALFAYVLAVVVDDAAQRITHVVRGADLLDDTPRQIYLQQLLGLTSPAYAHVSLLVEPDGSKLAKTLRSVPVASQHVMPTLLRVFRLLNLSPPSELLQATPAEAWGWGIRHWRIDRMARRLRISVCKP